MMTQAQFFKLLPRSGWNLINGQIRHGINCECPIVVAFRRSKLRLPGALTNCNFQVLGETLGLCSETIDRIVKASDERYPFHEDFRRKMLKYCGLGEKLT